MKDFDSGAVSETQHRLPFPPIWGKLSWRARARCLHLLAPGVVTEAPPCPLRWSLVICLKGCRDEPRIPGTLRWRSASPHCSAAVAVREVPEPATPSPGRPRHTPRGSPCSWALSG